MKNLQKIPGEIAFCLSNFCKFTAVKTKIVSLKKIKHFARENATSARFSIIFLFMVFLPKILLHRTYFQCFYLVIAIKNEIKVDIHET